MATAALDTDFVNLVASEMAAGVERAVECWLVQIEQILATDKLSSFEKLDALNAMIQGYKQLTGKSCFENNLYQ